MLNARPVTSASDNEDRSNCPPPDSPEMERMEVLVLLIGSENKPKNCNVADQENDRHATKQDQTGKHSQDSAFARLSIIGSSLFTDFDVAELDFRLLDKGFSFVQSDINSFSKGNQAFTVADDEIGIVFAIVARACPRYSLDDCWC